jgi:hypothetical protein
MKNAVHTVHVETDIRVELISNNHAIQYVRTSVESSQIILSPSISRIRLTVLKQREISWNYAFHILIALLLLFFPSESTCKIVLGIDAPPSFSHVYFTTFENL